MKDVLLVVFDFDGVMTDNRVQVHQSGEEAVFCHRGDGLGIGRLKAAGFEILVLSTEANPVVAARCRKLNIEGIQECDDKAAALRRLASERNLSPHQIAYVGNDLNDVACMQWVGWPIAVADAVPEVRAVAKWVTRRPGGRGAVREVADQLISSRHDRDPAVEWVRRALWQSIEIRHAIGSSSELLGGIVRVGRTVTEVLMKGGRIILLGSGESALVAERVAGELARRLPLERNALPAIALTVGGSPRSATGQDHAHDGVLARQIETKTCADDIAIGITAARSFREVVLALETAHAIGLRTVVLAGSASDQLDRAAEECLCVPSDRSTHIAEAQMLIGHLLCDYVELALGGEKPDDSSQRGA